MVNMQFLMPPFANIARPKGDPKNTKGDVSSGRQTCHRDGMTPRPPAAIPALMLMTVDGNGLKLKTSRAVSQCPDSSQASRANFVSVYVRMYAKSKHKLPGGWETALAVEHFLKRNSSGAVAPYTFYDEHYLKFCRSKLNDFEGMSWYLQGFVVVAGWKPFPCSSLACHFSKRLLRARPVRLRKSVEFPWCHRHCQILIP